MEGEKDFDDWMESIAFVDGGGKDLETELKEDRTDDPEGDRG